MKATNSIYPSRTVAALALTLACMGTAACTKKAPPDATAATGATEPQVSFLEPADGATVGQKFKVRMNVEGFEIGPLGDLTQGKGHHHIVVNGTWIKDGEVVPTDEKHIHFGKGQTETELELKPGKYSLTLQFADGAHRSYGEKLSQTINVTVQ